MDDSRHEAQKETGRVESFSDGVIAIAITLLILEIKIPKSDEIASVSLFIKLLDLWPSFLAFVTSFATILVMWVNHHRVFRLVRTTDYPFLYWNGFLLLTISFVPFPTALLAGHLTSPEAATATAVYCNLASYPKFEMVQRLRHAFCTFCRPPAKEETVCSLTAT